MNKVRITTKADQCLEVEQVGWTLKQIDTLTSLDIRKMTTLSSLGQLKLEHFGIFDTSKIKSDTFDIPWTHFFDAISPQHHT